MSYHGWELIYYWFILKRPQKLYPMPQFRWVPDCDDDHHWSNHNIPRATFNGCCWWFVAVCQGDKWIGDQEVVDEELLASGSAPPTPVNRRRGEAREGTRWAFWSIWEVLEIASKTMWHHEKDNGDAKDRQMVGEWSERWRPGLAEQARVSSLSNMLSSWRRKK